MPMLHISTVIASDSEAIPRVCSGDCHAVTKVIQKITDYPRLAMTSHEKRAVEKPQPFGLLYYNGLEIELHLGPNTVAGTIVCTIDVIIINNT